MICVLPIPVALAYIPDPYSDIYSTLVSPYTPDPYTNIESTFGEGEAFFPNPCDLYFNGTKNANRTYTYPEVSNVTGVCKAGVVNLYRDYVNVSNPEIIRLGVGVYRYEVNTTGTATYRPNSTVYYLTVEKGPTETVLYLNGTSADRYYELGSDINITGKCNISEGIVTLSMNASTFGDDFISGLANVIYNWAGSFAEIFKFNDTTEMKNITSDEIIWFSIDNRTQVNSARLNLTGYLLAGSYPLDVYVDTANDSVVDFKLAGYLNGTVAFQNEIDGLIAKNFTFSEAGSLLGHIKIPKGVEIISAKINVSGFDASVWTSETSIFALNYEEDELLLSFDDPDWIYTKSAFRDWFRDDQFFPYEGHTWDDPDYDNLGGHQNVTFNLTLPDNTEKIKFHFAWWNAHIYNWDSLSTEIFVWNFTDSTWNLAISDYWTTPYYAICMVKDYVVELPFGFIQGNKARFKINFRQNDANPGRRISTNSWSCDGKSDSDPYRYWWVEYVSSRASTWVIDVPRNPTLDVADSGPPYEWSYSGDFNESVSPETVDLNTSLVTEWLKTCIADENGICSMPITISSETPGTLQIDAVEIKYNINPVDLNVTSITEYFSRCDYECDIPIRIANLTQGKLGLGDLIISYYGSITYNATAYCLEGPNITASSDTQFIKLVWSNFSVELPPGVEWWEVFPVTVNDTNVTPLGQDSVTPIWNITSLAYEQPINVSLRLDEALDPCVNITASADNIKDNGNLLTTSYITYLTNLSEGESGGIWNWVDLIGCDYDMFAYFQPNFSFAACCYECLRCW